MAKKRQFLFTKSFFFIFFIMSCIALLSITTLASNNINPPDQEKLQKSLVNLQINVII